MTNSAISFAVLDCGAVPTLLHCLGVFAHGLGPIIIAIDGKTLRRSYQDAGAKAPIHMISAWSARQNLVLGQAQGGGQVQRDHGHPAALGSADDQSATVTIDAMGCRARSPRKIKDKQADYVLALKGNQGSLRDDVELLFTEQRARHFADLAVDRHETVERAMAAIETRITTVTDDIAWLKQNHGWPGLRSIVHGRDRARDRPQDRARGALLHRLPRFRCRRPRRGHPQPLSIENGLHWVMDMVFQTTNAHPKENAPANFAAVKHMASNLLRRAPGKDSLRVSAASRLGRRLLASLLTR